MSDALLTVAASPPVVARAPLPRVARRPDVRVRAGRRQADTPADPAIDALTGLLNRTGLEVALTALVDSGEAARGIGAMLCVDLGGPDVLAGLAARAGTEAVEDVLRRTGTALRHAVRGADAVGRLGGDDFIIVLQGLGDLANASRIAETVLLALRRVHADSGGLAPRIGAMRLPASGRAISAMFAAREQVLAGD